MLSLDLEKEDKELFYWVDGDNNVPRYFNFDNKDKFKDSSGNWDIDKFSLFLSYSKIPEFSKVEVLNSGGALKAGSYNISIQYLDSDLNPTEWITTSEIIYIYNSSLTEEYLKINGSINSDKDYLNSKPTNKSIQVSLSNLDEDFLFYRLAFIEATSGTGSVTSVKYTKEISIENNTFIYTGLNYKKEGTEEEILAVNNIISSADSIEQLDNRLILGNTEGVKYDLCSLQKIASKIKSYCIIKEINLSSMESSSFKNPTQRFNGGVGYMPGEIYSFGIVFIFKDNTLSPVYHIPGRPRSDHSTNTSGKYVSSSDPKKYYMSDDNTLKNNTYTQVPCSSKDYWGKDSEDTLLNNTNIRHHRFPTREEIGNDAKFFTKNTQTVDTGNSQTNLGIIIYKASSTTLSSDMKLEFDYKITSSSSQNQETIEILYPILNKLAVGKSIVIQDFRIITPSLNNNNNLDTATLRDGNSRSNTLTLRKASGLPSAAAELDSFTNAYSGFRFGYVYINKVERKEIDVYKGKILGIRFENIDISKNDDIAGYYIVRNERTEDEKTVLDSVCLVPTCIEKNNQGTFDYVATGLLNTEQAPNISKHTYSLIHLEHKFKDIKYENFNKIVLTGKYQEQESRRSWFKYNDVLDGSTYKKNHKGSDKDGWSLKGISRDTLLSYSSIGSYGTIEINKNDTNTLIYLNALESKRIKVLRSSKNKMENLYNISADNILGILSLKSEIPNNNIKETDILYGYIKRDLSNPYGLFRSLPYIKVSLNSSASSEIEVYNGDTYISPMRYVNSLFWDNRPAKRNIAKVYDNWQWITAIIVGVGLIALPFLIPFALTAAVVSVGAGVAFLGASALLGAAKIKQDELEEAYQYHYTEGLRKTILDVWIDKNYGKNQDCSEDTIQWIGESLTNLFFDSSINSSLRYDVEGKNGFLNAPDSIETTQPDERKGADGYLDYTNEAKRKIDIHLANKLTIFNIKRDDYKEYIGHVLGEWYEINPDYERLNKQKLFFCLPLQYDCCNPKVEKFPTRIFYSQQSFQEETIDNYKVFLPNNYRDIQSSTGAVKDLFTISNILFVHTEDSLYFLPQNYQERITNDIVSFIGTGEYFNIPARKIVDSEISVGGCSHKWATLKTRHGVFFVSEKERKIYRFDGKRLDAISSLGMNSWFQEYGFLNQTTLTNNPSNPLGSGFLSGYDPQKERILFTKIDKKGSIDVSWTLSFSLKSNSWVSFHSYIPCFYMYNTINMFTMTKNNIALYQHNMSGNYLNFYQENYDFVIELVLLSKNGEVKDWNEIEINSLVEEYMPSYNSYIEQRFKTFNRAIFYNRNQATNELELIVNNDRNMNQYMLDQIKPQSNSVTINKKDKSWYINNLRDTLNTPTSIIFKYNKPMEKVLDTDSFGRKDLRDHSIFRDKFLVAYLVLKSDSKIVRGEKISLNI